MTREKQLELINEMDNGLKDILISKSNDYANEDGDVLENFKRLAEASKVLQIDTKTPIGYALFMTIMKIDRIANLLAQNKAPTNEALTDSFADGCNYLKLAYCLFMEE